LNILAIDVFALVSIGGAIALVGWGMWWMNVAWFVFGIAALAKLGRHIPMSEWARTVAGLVFIVGATALLILAVSLNQWWWLTLFAAWMAYEDIRAFFIHPTRGVPMQSILGVQPNAAEQTALASMTPQEQELFLLLKKHQTAHCFYLLHEIPAEALHTARKRSKAPPEERILAYLDLSADEEGKYNLLVGSNGVYFHDAEKCQLALPFTEFPERVFVNHGRSVYLGKDQSFTPDLDSNDAFDCETIANLLNALRAWVMARSQAQPDAPAS
jgi:hypothetical protein